MNGGAWLLMLTFLALVLAAVSVPPEQECCARGMAETTEAIAPETWSSPWWTSSEAIDHGDPVNETEVGSNESPYFRRWRIVSEGRDGPLVRLEELWAISLDTAVQRVDRRNTHASLPGKYILTLSRLYEVEELTQLLRPYGAQSIRQIARRPVYVVTIDDDDEPVPMDVSGLLEKVPHFKSLDPEYLIIPSASPNDPYFGMQWHLHGAQGELDIGADLAWRQTTCSTRQVVAVIDTGFYLQHPDLQPHWWENIGEHPPLGSNGVDDDGNGYVDDRIGWDFLDDDADVTQAPGHGTHVAGIIAAVGNNGIGVTGVCQRARIMPLRAIGYQGTALSAVLSAIYYAIDHRATVINGSFALSGKAQAFEDAIAEAGGKNVLFIVAAGNNGWDIEQPGQDIYPASFNLPNMITVAAINQRGKLLNGSNFGGSRVHLGAPGADIYSTYPCSMRCPPYAELPGTSTATAVVSGIVLLIADRYPWLDAAAIKAHLLATGVRSQALEGKTRSGVRVHAGRAVTTLPGIDPMKDGIDSKTQ